MLQMPMMISKNKPVAYTVSLIKCGDHQSNMQGLLDAATVLAYSVYRHSARHPSSNSKYDLKLYAIVHTQAEGCSGALRDLGYEILLRQSPVQLEEMSSATLRKHAPRAWCCGEAEFIKLYAYTLLEHDIVVHVDMDFLMTKPMDDLYDSMLLDAHSAEGQAARSKIPLERPTDPWPDKIEAFVTRDWGQVIPGRKAGYQAGFVVLRPSIAIWEQVLDTIRKTDYDGGYSRENGWGRKGYGAFVGAAAMQGLMAYFYDQVRPGTTVELNHCRFNHMGMDVLFRAPPSFLPRHEKVGRCRNDLDHCEDCQTTPVEQIYGIHYTQCRKPWLCSGQGHKDIGQEMKQGIPDDNVIVEHCLELARTWNEYRTDLEERLFQLTGDLSIRDGQTGSYMPHIFKGHCKAFGPQSYIPIAGKLESQRRVPELFGGTAPSNQS